MFLKSVYISSFHPKLKTLSKCDFNKLFPIIYIQNYSFYLTGEVGTYPDCRKPECPPGTSGVYPNCVKPQCPAGKSLNVKSLYKF